jgi:quinol monooxygenase YgiN
VARPREEYDAASQVPTPELQIVKKEMEDSMFARIAQVTAKPGQASNISQAARERLVPMLKQQAGFVDVVILNSESDPNEFVTITLYKSKEDAEKALQQGQQLRESLRPLLQGEPVFRTFNVETSTVHNLGITKAATSS